MHRHLHTLRHTQAHTHTTLGYISKRLLAVLPVPACFWLPFAVLVVLPLAAVVATMRSHFHASRHRRHHHHRTACVAVAVACSCHNSQSVSHCCCSCNCYSCSCSCFCSCFNSHSHLHLIPLPLLVLVLLLCHFLLLLPPCVVYFLQVADCGCLVVAFPDPGGGYWLWPVQSTALALFLFEQFAFCRATCTIWACHSNTTGRGWQPAHAMHTHTHPLPLLLPLSLQLPPRSFPPHLQRSTTFA